MNILKLLIAKAEKLLPSAALVTALFTVSCTTKKTQELSIAVFIPGILSDSPVYSMLASGVQTAVSKYTVETGKKVQAEILEAGTNQADWGNKLTALAASGTYRVIISSNPSMPEIVTPIVQKFPNQKFILLDAFEEGNSNIATVRYNQREQAFLSGYIAALMSKTHKIGLITAQQYPVMDNVILPGYIEGAKAAWPATVPDYRIVGNWYDASKGSELAHAMFNAGVDVILPVCGGASQGVIAAAKELGFYITWFDNNGFSKAPGSVISSTVIKQDKMAQKITSEFLAGETAWGSAKTVGVKDGYVDFIQDDPLYISTVPEPVRSKVAKLVESVKNGSFELSQ